ncbi:MAG: S8 family serine peptidase [Phycisphaerales bacterium]|nr:S8 family serine peptidase [Phycisphaerales bacterium]
MKNSTLRQTNFRQANFRQANFRQAMKITAVAAGLAIVLASGSAVANDSFLNPGIKAVDGTRISGSAAPVSLSNAQKRSITKAFNWETRDAGLLDGSIVPSEIFTETIGLKERTNRLTVKVKTQSQMLQQMSTELAMAEAAGQQVRAVAAGAQGGAEFVGQAQLRMVEARSRIEPSLIEAFDDVDMHTIHLPFGVSAETMAEVLMQTGDYEFVSIDWLCYPVETIPNDPRINLQWYHPSTRIDTYGAWDFTTGSGEIIAVCDTGVDQDHPDLQGALVSGFNAVTNLSQANGGIVDDTLNGHGTMVAGSAAAIGNNGVGVSGVGWNFGIMSCRVSINSGGTAFLSDILQGARWGSDNGAYVSNCSYGGAEDNATNTTGISIRSQGNLLVFSSGNSGVGNQTNDWAKVIIVGASNSSDNYAAFSNFGVGIDCIAPGTNIQTTTRGGGYGNTTGTSFSSPITAGALMLIRSANPALSADEVEAILLNSCDDKQAVGEDNQTGNGRINVGRAIEDAIFGPSAVSLPFADLFNDPSLALWRDLSGAVTVNSDALAEPSGPDSLNLSGTAQINTVMVRAAEFFLQTGQISFYTQHSGTEAGEDLVVEYANIAGIWTPLTVIPSDGVDQSEFAYHLLEVPGLAIHNDFRLRFTTTSDQSDDNWFIDDVEIKFFEGNTVPWIDTFESGISLNFNWESSNAAVSTLGDNEPSGTLSANLDNTDSMTTKSIDVTTAEPIVYVQFYTQHKGVEAGESLLVEYKNIIGTWAELTTIVSDGVDQSGFDLNQLELPFIAYGADLQLRLTAQGDEADDDWFVDNIAVTMDFIDEPDPCPADINGDGVLDFFDISAFLSAFGANDPISDFNGDGAWDFFDISAFLSAFSSGCP